MSGFSFVGIVRALIPGSFAGGNFGFFPPNWSPVDSATGGGKQGSRFPFHNQDTSAAGSPHVAV